MELTHVFFHIACCLQKFLSQRPPQLTTPSPGGQPDFYGFWVGLQADGPALSKVLTGSSSATTKLTWEDGATVQVKVLQSAWGRTTGTKALSGVPMFRQNMCVHMSNSTALTKPGLEPAESCGWRLPYVCAGEQAGRVQAHASRPPAVT